MLVFQTRLRRVGNSFGLLVPKEVVDDLHAREGDAVEVALMPPPEERRLRLDELVGSCKGLPAFERDRKDRF